MGVITDRLTFGPINNEKVVDVLGDVIVEAARCDEEQIARVITWAKSRVKGPADEYRKEAAARKQRGEPAPADDPPAVPASEPKLDDVAPEPETV